jgi:transposase
MSPVFDRIGINGYRVLGYDKEEKITIHAETWQGPRSCPYCGTGRLHSKGRYRRRARHLDCFGSASQLLIHTRRYRCVECGRSFVPSLPGLLPWRQSTEPWREKVYQHPHHGICASALARLMELGQASVERIYQQFTRRKANERLSLQCPRVLGIDEHSLHKGQRFATTLCDLKNHRVFDIVPGRSEADLRGFISRLEGRHQVRVVCIDLSSPYRHLIRSAFPNAKIVADRFHVVRLIIHHFMELARQIAPAIKNQRSYLGALRKRTEHLSAIDSQRLGALFNAYPTLEPLYEMMHRLRRIMNIKHQTKRACRPLARQLLGLIDQLKRSAFSPLVTLAQTLKTWIEPIAAMWRFTKNNGITEGFHRKMKLIQRRAYGFRNFNNYRLRVIAQCGG